MNTTRQLTPPTPSEPAGPSIETRVSGTWRERFLRSMLIGASIVGFFAVVSTFLTGRPPIFLIFYSIAYAILLVITLARLPYWFKAGFLLFIIFAIGVSGLLESGIWGYARVFFLAFIVMAGLLFSPAAARNAIIISLLATAAIGWLILSGRYLITNPEVSAGDPGTWISGVVGNLLLAVVIITGLNQFLVEFRNAQRASAQSLQQLEVERSQLEHRVFLRTQELEQRTGTLRAVAYIARQIADIQDVPTLLKQVVQLASDRLGIYHVAIFLLDSPARTAFMQAASSEAGRLMVERGYQVQAGAGNGVAYVLENKKAFRMTRSGDSKSPGTDPELPLTRSQLTLPLSVRGNLIGVIDFQSDRSQAFSEEDAGVLETMSDQLAASVDNARLLNETRAIVTQLQVLTSKDTRATWQEFLRKRAPAYQYSPSGIKAIPVPKAPLKKGLRFPLRLRGQEIGAITLQRREAEGSWGERELDLIEKVTSQVALALDNSRLLEESRRRAFQEQTVGEISARLGRSLDIDSLLQTAARELGALPEVSEVSVIIGEVNSSSGPSRSG